MGGMTVVRKTISRAIALLVTMSVAGCEGPQPITMITFWDASASSLPYQKKCQKLVPEQTRRFLPRDSLALYRVAQRVTSVYSGKALGKSLESTYRTYFKVDTKERGTSLGTAFRLAIRDTRQAIAKGRRPVLLFLGDLADEKGPGTENIDWQKLPRLVAELPPETRFIFVYSEPRFTEHLETSLRPILQDRLTVITPALAETTGGRRLLRDAIGR